jgi:hypothetical protein
MSDISLCKSLASPTKSTLMKLLFSLVLAGLLLSSPGAVFAQSAMAEITGVITDSSRAPVPGVTVTLTNIATGVKIAALSSNEVGLYYVRSLPPGVYSIEAVKSGFKTFRADEVQGHTGQVLRFDILLEVGNVVTTVKVTAQAGVGAIQRESSDISSLINARSVEELPVLGRRVIDLVEITPGVAMNYDNGLQPFFSVAGSPGVRSHSYYIDGGNTGYPRTQGDGGNLPIVNPTPDVVEEMRVETKNYSAEFGEAGGAVIMLTTKSGTNSYHGEAYTYIQNEGLNARDFFAPTRPTGRLNQYGGIFSGPVVKNKLFFFGNIERQRTGGGGFPLLTVPSAVQRSGDFSPTFDAKGNLIPIYDPLTTCGTFGNPACALDANGHPIITRQQFPGNIIPSNRFDPVAAKVAAYWPSPNSPGLITGGNNFLGRANNTNHPATDHVRVDYQLSEKQRLYFRYSYNRETIQAIGPFQGTPGALADPGGFKGGDFWPSMGISYTWVLSANTINELRFNRGNTLFHHRRFGNSTGTAYDFADKLGLHNLGPQAFPQFNVSGYTQLGSGAGGWQQLDQDAMRDYVLEETLTHRKGSHNLRIGGAWKDSRAIYGYHSFPSGESDYDVRATALPNVAGTGNGFASFLLGLPNNATVQNQQSPDIRTWYAAGFVQDDWRVTRSVTLNLGVRYEYDTPKRDLTNSFSGFDPYKVNPVCNCPGVITFSSDYWNQYRKAEPFYNALYGTVSPRLGFAYSPWGRSDLVVRGGAGMFMLGNDYGDNFWGIPLHGAGTYSVWTSDALGLTPAFQLSQGFPVVAPPSSGTALGLCRSGKTQRLPQTGITLRVKQVPQRNLIWTSRNSLA